MVKINMSSVLLDLKGKPLTEKPKDEEERELTLGIACTTALVTPSPTDKLTGKESFDRYNIAMKIANSEGDEFDLESQEITKIKECIGNVYPPIVVGRAWDLLEGK